MLLQFMLLSHHSQLLSFQGFSIFLWNAVIQEKLCHYLLQTCELQDKLSTAGDPVEVTTIFFPSAMSSFIYVWKQVSVQRSEKCSINEEDGLFYSQTLGSISQQTPKALADQGVVLLCW